MEYPPPSGQRPRGRHRVGLPVRGHRAGPGRRGRSPGRGIGLGACVVGFPGPVHGPAGIGVPGREPWRGLSDLARHGAITDRPRRMAAAGRDPLAGHSGLFNCFGLWSALPGWTGDATSGEAGRGAGRGDRAVHGGLLVDRRPLGRPNGGHGIPVGGHGPEFTGRPCRAPTGNDPTPAGA